MEFSLESNETATLIGEYDILVSSGIITIYGTILRPNSGEQRVYAPSVQALPQIQARQDNTKIRVSSVTSSLRKLDKLSPLFRNMWATEGKSFAFLRSSDDENLQRSVNALEIDREMDTVLRTLSAKVSMELRKPRIMGVGAKSSGKSTFNRVLCNHLHSWTPMKKCMFLDLDPGQPEFGLPGQISLVEVTAPILGPPFTHPASAGSKEFRILRSHAIAATSFKDDPEHYKACALDLVKHADTRYPLVVNSCGWVSGLGATVLAQLVSALAITDLVLLEPLESTLVDSMQAGSDGIAFHRIPRRAPKPSSRTPAESRAMQTMAYFHHRGSIAGGVPRWSSKSISRTRPWVVSYAGSDPGIFAIMSYGQSPNSEFLAEVLEGSVVAMVVLDKHAAVSNISPTPADGEKRSVELADLIDRTPADDLPYIKPNPQGITHTLFPSTSHCAGLALIRGIDTKRKRLQLVTPLPESEIAEIMDKRVVLIRGNLDAPAWAYLEDLYEGDGGESERERPWVSRKEMVGIEGAVWRLRHPPLPATVIAANR